MRVNELMHGDWVLFQIQNNEPAQVCGKILSYEKELGNAEVDLLPMPITPEILEKNGFSDRGKAGWQNPDYDVTYYWELNTFSHNVYKQEHIDMILNVQYVHELQHALRLCGLNELADNFKV